LDEVLRSLDTARNRLIDLERCSDEELDQIEQQFRALRGGERQPQANGAALAKD
jgi:low affinity Fe/Cu permease